MADEGMPPPPRFPPVDEPPQSYGQGPSWPPGFGPPDHWPRTHWLHPLDVGRTFSAAWRLYRHNWRSLLGPSALFLLPGYAAVAYVQAYVFGPVLNDLQRQWFRIYSGELTAPAFDFNHFAGPLAALLVISLITAVLGLAATAAAVRVVDQTYRGSPASAKDAVVTALRKLPTLIVVSLLLFFLVLGLILVGGLVIILAGGLLTALVGREVATFVGLIGLVGTFVAIVFMGLRWYLAIQVVICEDGGPLQAMRRSWRVVAGSTWRLLGYFLLLVLLAFLVGLVVGIPVTLLSLGDMMRTLSAIRPGEIPVVQFSPFTTFLTTFLSGAVQVAVVPFEMAVLTLLYYDLRWRQGEEIPDQSKTTAGAPVAQA
jgi:hypothetical protein